MELADVSRTLLARPGGDAAAQVLGETARVAGECDPLAAAGEAAGLLECQPGLAAAGPAADLDPAQQLGRVEDGRLLMGELLGDLLALRGQCDDVALGEAAPAEDLGKCLGVVLVGDAVRALLADRDVPEPAGEVVEVLAAGDAPARAVRQGEVVGDRGLRQHDGMGPPEPAAVTRPPPRVALDVAAQCVLGAARLVDRVDRDRLAAAALPPRLAVVPDLAALDLDDDQARSGQDRDQVGLVVHVIVGDAQVRVEDVLRAQLLAEQLPHLALARRREPRPVGHAHRHRGLLPEVRPAGRCPVAPRPGSPADRCRDSTSTPGRNVGPGRVSRPRDGELRRRSCGRAPRRAGSDHRGEGEAS